MSGAVSTAAAPATRTPIPSSEGYPAWSWGQEDLHQALMLIAQKVLPSDRPPRLDQLPKGVGELTSLQLSRWIVDASHALGLLPEAKDTHVKSVVPYLVEGGPVLIGVPIAEGWRFLVVLKQQENQVVLLTPEEEMKVLPLFTVDEFLESTRAGTVALSGFCQTLRLSEASSLGVHRILGEGNPGRNLAFSFDPLRSSFWSRFFQAEGRTAILKIVATFILVYCFLLGSWWLLGEAAMGGRLEAGWFAAWIILLQNFVIARVFAQWSVGRLAIVIAGLARERLLEGILRTSAEEMRVQGIGKFLGHVLDADALDAASRTGGPAVATNVFQIGAGMMVLAMGAAPWLHFSMILLWLIVSGILVRRLYSKVRDWAEARLMLTDELVETMVGYRTLLAQLPAGERLKGQEASLDSYLRRTEALDRSLTFIGTVLPRGWLILSVLAMIPTFAVTRNASPAIAVSFGGILLVYFAFRSIAAETGPGLATAFVAWRNIKHLFIAAPALAPTVGAVSVLPMDDVEGTPGGRPLILARDLTFRFPKRLDPVLRGCDFEIRRGDRWLLLGASGSGKSTLASLVTGLRKPTSGLLLLGGFDQHSMRPEHWRQRAASVPQGHENHILSAPLLFNIAMARRWPVTQEDVEEIHAVCHELGLGKLLERMPGGMQQMIGDSGWQLSHGEKARVCVARALVQAADVRVLDESFAALDPETLDQVLECILQRSETLLVVSHL